MNSSIVIRNRIVRTGIVTFTVMLSISSAVLAETATTSERKHKDSIPFANHGGIRDWQPDGDKGMWIQGTQRRWYYAKFFAPCTQLSFAMGVRFIPEATGDLNRFSSIVVPREGRCRFSEFTASNGPPVKKKGAKGGAAAETPVEKADSKPAVTQ